MVRRKKVRTRGKLQLSRYFQILNIGDSVSIVKERSVKSTFPARIQGRTGTIEEKRGQVYLIKLKDQNKEKRFLVEPIHLKKLKHTKLIAKNDTK